MAKTQLLKNYMVKRLDHGRIRFILRPDEHLALKALLEEVADDMLDGLDEFADAVSAWLRALAQEMLTRRYLLMTLADKENTFVLSKSEALGVLSILWSEPLLETRPILQILFGELHQLLS
ncbi:hypothetical protein SAMN02745146_0071 [Hymenobacter daecheongensis DSM 21074]|uniref:Uncharacterized protein n=1 Tax=Hymenobacter daecheongensis DSM 21074 TaxID=1121955 RepID=A0A1M6LVN3_9BACT|nr:hypothetical protein [Hymenobacter daecheongensis]SHJ75230.1 hypothetical protein SAMN02745146_0071 [Hymenobacter daecheongensis DSM 21074]